MSYDATDDSAEATESEHIDLFVDELPRLPDMVPYPPCFAEFYKLEYTIQDYVAGVEPPPLKTDDPEDAEDDIFASE